ncbi:DNA topoisomerase 2-like isoform X2 [Panicum miliaceum]|uniref:DNA topoisomerase (ATP-hydrolyzing) n=1 Tax=Panicum miliaceum TaxID=4540 RepID=A0A3L6Q159_PANMI|nr:DNA topoisomerase 2-like isoform X2 [Panicum miliaceum]
MEERGIKTRLDWGYVNNYPLFMSYVDANYGSVDSIYDDTMLVFDGAKLKWSKVSYTPALVGIVEDFILKAVLAEGVDTLKIEFSTDDGYLTVGHNGRCMDFEVNGEMEGKSMPQLIFGGSNGNTNMADWEEKFKSYRVNPAEPSLEQIIHMLSGELEIELKDAAKRAVYKQVLRSKTHQDMKPEIGSYDGSHNWSRVRFKFFGTSTEGFEKLLKTRLVEINATIANKVTIEYNDQTLDVKNFSQLVDVYPSMILEKRPDANKRFCIKVGDQIELGITRSNGAFTQYCFINGRRTKGDATNINLVVKRILKHARKKDRNVNEDELKSNMTLFMSCLDAPSDAEFNTRLSGLPDDFLNKCVDNISNIAWKKCEKMKALDDAIEAGGKNSMKCTLILAEGDSAKSFVMSGMGVLGREHYGVLSLMGKVENVRDSDVKHSVSPIIRNIMNALGLDFEACYKTAYKLRYGHVMFMMDQDADGIHTKGLLLNSFDKYWPSLLKIDRFLSDFTTPLVKEAAKNGGAEEIFYTMESFNRSDVKRDMDSWNITHIKGLGTLMAEEAKDYFANIYDHRRYFKWSGEIDSSALEICFAKYKLNARKIWILRTRSLQLQSETEIVAVDPTEKFIKYHRFLDKEFSRFVIEDLLRSVPSMMDGLKTTQRKVLFAAMEDLKEKKRISDPSLLLHIRLMIAGDVVCKTVYRHGRSSMKGTIIGMAQTFVGSNNVNLLKPRGQFGSRYEGGKDHSTAYYLFVELNDITKFIFRDDDKYLLEYLEEDGKLVQPKWYLPVVPMSLVNGTTGIASGWASNIPNYHMNDVINALFKLLRGPTIAEDSNSISLKPGYRGFKGRVEKSTDNEHGINCTIYGCVTEISDTVIEINEIPPGRTIVEYKSFLQSLLPDASNRSESSKMKYPTIECFQELHEDANNLRFRVSLDKGNMMFAKNRGLLEVFNLVSRMSVETLNLLDEMQKLRQFLNAEETLTAFYDMRLPYYAARKAKLLERMSNDMTRIDNTIMYLEALDKGEIKQINRKKLIAKFTEKGYKAIPNDGDSGFDHLINLSCDELDVECVPNLMAEREGLHQ